MFEAYGLDVDTDARPRTNMRMLVGDDEEIDLVEERTNQSAIMV
jgi:hypothetical protein